MRLFIAHIQGGFRGLFRAAKMDIVTVMGVLFAIVNKFPFYLMETMGLTLNKNTWTLYVKVINLSHNYFVTTYFKYYSNVHFA